MEYKQLLTGAKMPRIKSQWTLNWEREGEDEYLKYIKARIKEAREDAKMTQSELAQKLERNQVYFSKLESGGLVPSVIELLGIAQFTKKPVQFFMPLQEESEDILTGKEWQLVAHFRRIEDEGIKDLALSTIKNFAEKKTKGK